MIDPNDGATGDLPLEGGGEAGMAEIPPNTPYDPMKALGEWFLLRKQLSDIKNAEMAARKQLFTHFFPSPKEGTNTYDLPDGYKLKGTYALERKVDEAVWQVNREKFAEAKIPETVIRWTPELAKSNYNELTAEQQTFFDQCLIIKPGAPTLEITKPKPKGKAGEVHEG